MLLPNLVPFLHRLPTLVHLCLLLVKVFFMKCSFYWCLHIWTPYYGAPKLGAVRAVPHAQLKDRNREMLTRDGNREMLTRDGNPLEGLREGGDLNAKPPNPADRLLIILPPNPDTIFKFWSSSVRANASTQSDHNRSKKIGAFHATALIGARTKSCYANSSKGPSLKSFRTRTTEPGGIGLFGKWNMYISHQMGRNQGWK